MSPLEAEGRGQRQMGMLRRSTILGVLQQHSPYFCLGIVQIDIEPAEEKEPDFVLKSKVIYLASIFLAKYIFS